MVGKQIKLTFRENQGVSLSAIEISDGHSLRSHTPEFERQLFINEI